MNNVLENKRLTCVLEALENSIEPDVEDILHKEWLDFTEDRFIGDVFEPKRTHTQKHEQIILPDINDTLSDTAEGYVNMLINQYASCLNNLEKGNGSLLCVRSSYGCGTLPYFFGCEPFIMPREQNILPSSLPLGGDAIEKLVSNGVPALSGGMGEQAFKAGELMLEIAQRYPKIGSHVHVIHPDTQGPFDIAELLWGTDIFCDLYDRPGLAHSLLKIICETYTVFMHRWLEMFPCKEYTYHWGYIHKGAVMLRDDSAMNLSPELFDEFIKPYDSLILDTFGGGAVHFCGRGDHYIDSLCTIKGLSAINMSQPEYNDMEKIYKATVDRGIKIIGLNPQTAKEAGARLKGQVSM